MRTEARGAGFESGSSLHENLGWFSRTWEESAIGAPGIES
jgi:hypothetical protein